MHAAIRSSGVWTRPPPPPPKPDAADVDMQGDVDMPQAGGSGDDRGAPVGRYRYHCGTCSAWHVRDQFLPTAVNDWLGP